LIILGKGDRDLAVSQRSYRGRLHRKYFAQGQLPCALGGESTIKDDVDDVLRILKILSFGLVTFLVILLVLSLSYLREGWCIDYLADGDTLEERVSRLRVYWALFVHDFLIFRVIDPRLLATRIALDSRGFMVWLALLGIPRVVPLAFVEMAADIALLVVVALGEAVVLLVLLVSPLCHHVPQLHGSSRTIVPEVMVRVLQEEPVLETVDDILVGDVGNGGAYLEEVLV
jgi:hypothetical protein